MTAYETVVLVIYTLILVLPSLYLIDRWWTINYSLSKDVRIVGEKGSFHLERKLILFRVYIELTNIPRTPTLDKMLDVYLKIQKGEWGKKLIINHKDL